MIGVFGAIALFFIQVVILAFLLVRALVVPATLLVVEPTQLARRFLRRMSGAKGRAALDINVDAKDLRRMLNGWQATGTMLVLCLLAFALERHAAYLFLAAAVVLPSLAASSEPVDERSFEQFSRSLAAVSDGVLVGTLFLAMLFRPAVDAFGLLALLFAVRELALVLVRRWLASDPEFEPFDNGAGDGSGPGSRVVIGPVRVDDAKSPPASPSEGSLSREQT